MFGRFKCWCEKQHYNITIYAHRTMDGWLTIERCIRCGHQELVHVDA